MALTLYGIARSRAFRNMWTAGELGIGYEHVKTDFSESGTKNPAFRSVNPNASVPVIDDDGFKLWESLAINLYLAKKHADKGLYPSNLKDEAKVWQWTLWAAANIEGPVGIWGMHTQALPLEKRDAKQAADGLQKLQGPLKVLDDHLAKQQFLVGNSFTIADLNLASVMIRALQMDLKAYPHVHAWLNRCLDRPAALAARKLRDAA